MIYMLIRHKVKDYPAWKKVSDAHLGTREKAGLTERFVLQGEDDPHEVIILLEVGDLDKAKAFAGSKDLQDTMKEAGVMEEPDIYYLHEGGAAFAKAAGF